MAFVKSNSGKSSLLPKTTDTPPNETESLDNLELVIVPASWALVIVPTRFVVLYFTASVKLNAGVASVPPKLREMPP